MQKGKGKAGGAYTRAGAAPRREEKKERTKPNDGGTSKTTKQLLGELYNDREFLEKLYDSTSTFSFSYTLSFFYSIKCL